MPLVATAAIVICAAMPLRADAQTASNPQVEKSQLEIEKLQEEIRKLQIENDHEEGLTADLFRWVPFITVVGGVITIFFTVRKEVRENRKQRADEMEQRKNELDRRAAQADLDRKQRETELKQQQFEAQRRFDELFAQAVANLGSDKESVQLSAVVVLENSLRAEDEAFQDQVYSVVVANLAIEHAPLVNRFLVRAFEKAVRLRLATPEADIESEPLDLANCSLPRVDLHGLPLENVDVAFATLRDANLVGATLTNMRGYDVDLERARLSGADLTGARLHGAQCKEAQFHNATLVDVKLRASKTQHADLRTAEFYGAKMQGAHLEGADLTGARFDDAVLSDAYFKGATFDEGALRSILGAKALKDRPIWRSAHFDPEVEARLEVLAGVPARGRRARPPSPTPGSTNP